jgi:hypothetical protein
LATKIDADIKEALERVCREKGYKMNRFIEEALLDKFEEMEDVEDLRKLRREPTRSLQDILKDLKKHGKI